MITEDDLQFHLPDNIPYNWAETGYFNFYVPEANIFVWLYYIHRAGVGVTISDIEIIDCWSRDLVDSVYVDFTNHNPLPKDATRFSLPSGLSFEAASLSHYHLTYHAAGVAIDVTFDAIMPPFDIHDPAMDPMAVEDEQLAIAQSGFGTAYASHFDMSVHARGTLALNGTSYAVDCACTMDHSWGPRPENDFQPLTWTNAHFGDDYVVHAMFAFDKDGAPGNQHIFRHGYACVDGRVRGVKAASVQTVRDGYYPTYVEMELVDLDDRVHKVHGAMVCHRPWQVYGNCFSPMGMVKWWSPDRAEPGYGTYFDSWPLNKLRVD